MRYDIESIKKKYLSLIKPKKILFGVKNEIYDDCLIINSKRLYKKYKNLFKET